MPPSAFLLVILAALAHATWNFLAKRAAHSKHLIWFSSVAEALLFAPLAMWVLSRTWSALGLSSTLFLLATGVLHLLYTECLVRGYRAGDLTIVYPLARGTAPLLSFCGAIALLHEHASLLSVAGALLITFGIFLAAGGLAALRSRHNHAALWWGMATGCVIAAYTLVDGYSVKVLALSPILVDYAGNFLRTAVLSAGVYRRRTTVPTEFLRYWKPALGIGVLTPLGYILVLFAMRMAPVSHVAPMREMSMIIGIFFGARFLGEGDVMRRAAGSILIAAGVGALAFG